MRIQRIPIEEIKPASYNPRRDLQPGDPEYERLRGSLEAFGCVEPLVWNRRTGNLVGGHQRLKVLAEQGASHVDVSVVDLPPDREKALNIALNRIGGDWDQLKLAELLDQLTKVPDLDIELTGFEPPDVEALVAEVLHARPEAHDDFDVEAALDTKAVTRPGELIELGRHRLLCGDAAKAEDIGRLLGDRQKIDLLFTDPPYNVDYYGGNRPQPAKARPKPSRQWDRIYADDLAQDDYVTWLGGILEQVTAVLAPGAAFYVWNGHRQLGPMHQLLERLGLKVSCVITWAKESFSIGYGDYNQQTEFCLYGWKPNDGAGGHRWYGPTNETTLWQVRRDPTRSYQHPTQKPLELAERAIGNSTRPGQLVVDTFLGSGTTLIAAERTGRRCLGLEIDPHYCDVIVRRYLALCGPGAADAKLARRYRLDGGSEEVAA